VRWSRWAWPFVCGRPERIWLWAPPLGSRVAKARRPNSLPFFGEHALELPACWLQLGGETAGELRGLLDGRPEGRADGEIGPAGGAVAVDRGDLPDRAGAAVQPADEEAVEADKLARPLDVDIRLRPGSRAARTVRGSPRPAPAAWHAC